MTIFVFCSTYTNNCYGHDVYEMLQCDLYDDEGGFVEYPSVAGAVIGWIISLPPALILASPAILLPSDYAEEYSNFIIRNTIGVTAKTLSVLFGAPSYLIKKAFWDGPIYLLDANHADEKN